MIEQNEHHCFEEIYPNDKFIYIDEEINVENKGEVIEKKFYILFIKVM